MGKINKFLKHLFIIFVLFLIWVGLSFLYILSYDMSLTVLSYNHGKESFRTITNDKLVKGKKLTGEFKAQEDNLGIVSIKFKTFLRPNFKDEDILVFRIKEKGAKDWYYQNSYRSGLIYEMPFFPFGFPKIPDSHGKTYYFEIESLRGHTNNSVALSNRGQIFFSKYQVSKSLLLHNKKEFAMFAVKKLVCAILTTDVKFSSIIYSLPLLFYLLWIFPLGQFYKKNITQYIKKIIKLTKNKFYFIVLGVIVIDIFVIQLTNDIVYLVLLFLWIATLHLSNKNSKMTFFVAICMLLVAPVFLFLKDPQTAEKGASWAYIFLVAGIIQLISELKKKPEMAVKENIKVMRKK